MIAHKKEFFGGVALMGGFIVILIAVFMPLFNGHNGLEYLDALYNSISKGSAYYIPKYKEESSKFAGNNVTMTLKMKDAKQAEDTALLFTESGATADVAGDQIKVSGDLGKILENSLADSDSMYNNDGQGLTNKYGYNERQVLYNWWSAMKVADKDLKKQKKFKEAKIVTDVKKKCVETCYNYYKIEPQSITDRMGVVIFSLVFYVAYTMWYGFSILFMFEGWGLKLEH
jgi:hypothetical protein